MKKSCILVAVTSAAIVAARGFAGEAREEMEKLPACGQSCVDSARSGSSYLVEDVVGTRSIARTNSDLGSSSSPAVVTVSSMITISRRDGHSASVTADVPAATLTSLRPTSHSSISRDMGLSAGVKAGIIIGGVFCGMAIATVAVFLCLRRRQRPLPVERLHSPDEMEKGTKPQRHKEVAGLHELPGCVPEPEVTVTELADTHISMYEMMTQANTAELSGGTPVRVRGDESLFQKYARRSRSHTLEASLRMPRRPQAARFTFQSYRKRTRSDTVPIVSPLERSRSDAGRIFSPVEVSPLSGTAQEQVFSMAQWRRTVSGAALPASSSDSRHIPELPPSIKTLPKQDEMRAKIWAEKDRLAKMQMLDEQEAAMRREKDEKNREVSWG